MIIVVSTVDECDAVDFVVQMRQQNDLGELHDKRFSHVRYERVEFWFQITAFYNMADLHLTNVRESRFTESLFAIHGGQSIDVVVGHFVKC